MAGFCPVCLPALGGFLASLGLGFAVSTAFLQPFLLTLLLFSLGSLIWAWRRHRRSEVLLAGATGAVLVYGGRYLWGSPLLLWLGAACLIGTALINLRLKHHYYRCHNKEEVNTMATTRQVKVFSAGCPTCDEAVQLAQRLACPSCKVTIQDMHEPEAADRAKSLGIRSVPAVVIDGTLADCCTGRGVDEPTLRAAGLGQPR